MPRALWKGAISFGLVSIPVELHTAVRDSRPRFRLLHAHDKSPVRFERICQREGQKVAWEDLVKGYEYEKGRFVVLTKEDFETAAVAKSKSIDILDFVRADQIDDRYFETSYYLVPSAGGERAYALLREAMRREQRSGVAKFILRETQHLAAISVLEDALVITLMRFAQEVVPLDTFEFPRAKDVRRQELDMAALLINNLASDWQPEKYTDEYVNNLMQLIKSRAKGQAARLTAEVAPQQAEVIDLMERLRASLGTAKAETRMVKADETPRRTTKGGKASASRPRRRKVATRKPRKRAA